jgi:CRP-like cAMP-binding protein
MIVIKSSSPFHGICVFGGGVLGALRRGAKALATAGSSPESTDFLACLGNGLEGRAMQKNVGNLLDLSRADIFSDTPKGELTELEDVAQLCSFEPGQTVVEFDEPGERCLFVVVEGNVAIFHPVDHDAQVLLAEVGPGESFGELSVIEDTDGHAAAFASGPTLLARIPGAEFRSFLTDHPAVCLSLLKKLANGVRSLNAKLDDSATEDPLAAGLHRQLVRLTL